MYPSLNFIDSSHLCAASSRNFRNTQKGLHQRVKNRKTKLTKPLFIFFKFLFQWGKCSSSLLMQFCCAVHYKFGYSSLFGYNFIITDIITLICPFSEAISCLRPFLQKKIKICTKFGQISRKILSMKNVLTLPENHKLNGNIPEIIGRNIESLLLHYLFEANLGEWNNIREFDLLIGYLWYFNKLNFILMLFLSIC